TNHSLDEGRFGSGTIFLNALSKASASSASTSFAVPMNRLDCSGSSGFGFGFRPIARRYIPQSSKGNSSWNGRLSSRLRRSCFIHQPLALGSAKRDVRALSVIDAKPCARVLTKIKFSQITVEMLLIDVLINADHSALEDREKPFQRVRTHVAAC